jgi:hypothetical protein
MEMGPMRLCVSNKPGEFKVKISVESKFRRQRGIIPDEVWVERVALLIYELINYVARK